MQQIKIVTGWSNPGGSTVAHINLCNLFNASGATCTLYGPHTWHLDKCKSAKIETLTINPTDVIISHFLNPEMFGQFKPRKHILSCHETNMFPLAKLNYKVYDCIHFVSNSQKKYHSINWPSVIIPNVITPLRKSICTKRVAGVIGSVDRHKRTLESINRALKDGHNTILVYGSHTDPAYRSEIHKALEEDTDKVIFMGHEDDKQSMYDTVSEVYHSSMRETYNFIKFECELTGVKYNGLESAESSATMASNDEILSAWKRIINE